MNKVILIGRLTKDPEMHTTRNTQTSLAMFTMAVDRRYKDSSGERQADFLKCLAWKGTADFVAKYFRKGDKLGLVGSVQTRSYDDDTGTRRFMTEIVAEEVYFVENKRQQQEPEPSQETRDDDDYSLPFDI